MLKLFGIGFIVLCSSLIGISISEKLKKRMIELESINYLLEEISLLIKHRALTVFEIIDYLKSNEQIKELEFINNFIYKDNTPFYILWDKSIDNSNLSMKEYDLKLLKSFGKSLGTSNTDGQISIIQIFKQDFKNLYSNALKEYEKKSKLYRSLGILCGMLFSIVII